MNAAYDNVLIIVSYSKLIEKNDNSKADIILK